MSFPLSIEDKKNNFDEIACKANGTNSNIKSHTKSHVFGWNGPFRYVFLSTFLWAWTKKTRRKIFRKIWSKRLETDAGKHVYTVFDSTSLHVFGMLWHAALRHVYYCFEDLETIMFGVHGSFRGVGHVLNKSKFPKSAGIMWQSLPWSYQGNQTKIEKTSFVRTNF